MRDLFCLGKRRHAGVKDRIIVGIFMLIASALFAGQAMAYDFDLFGKPLTIKGFANQSIQFGSAGDHYDTKSGVQQAIMQALLEFEYYPIDDIKIFTSGMLYKDWAYNIYDSHDKWGTDQPPHKPVGRRFSQARDEMSLRDDYEDVLKECHVTWTPPGFNIRVEKQIVSWGRMDGVRIMDRINPVDRRLGPSDVEFETSITPIWLAKVEYYPDYVPPFLDECGIEFTFNPNADFIGDKLPTSGNSQAGIWAANRLEGDGFLRIGELSQPYDEPDRWSCQGFEYGLRIKGTLPDATYFTLNYFHGKDNSAVRRPDMNEGAAPFFSIENTGYVDDKNRGIYESHLDGYYPDLVYAGFTFSKDLDMLYIKALGGVAPLIRCEAVYEFDSDFSTRVPNATAMGQWESFEEHDVIFWGIGVDWKFKWNLLNERRYFSLVPQFSHKHIRDYPSDYTLMPTAYELATENEYSILIRMDTFYLHDKLNPMIIYQRDIHADVDHKISNGSAKADLWLFRLNYQPNHIWTYKAQLTLMDNDGYTDYKYMDHKDNISFTVQYQF